MNLRKVKLLPAFPILTETTSEATSFANNLPANPDANRCNYLHVEYNSDSLNKYEIDCALILMFSEALPACSRGIVENPTPCNNASSESLYNRLANISAPLYPKSSLDTKQGYRELIDSRARDTVFNLSEKYYSHRDRSAYFCAFLCSSNAASRRSRH